MGEPVRRDGRVVIEGVRRWTPWEMANSVIAAEVVAMRAVGEDVTYAFQMGVSGSAFRLQVSPSWCSSSPHSFCGYQTVRGAVEALPYAIEAHEVEESDSGGVERTRAAVRASIDRGFPCPYGDEEDGVIVGYVIEGGQLLSVHPGSPSDEPLVLDGWPWGIGVFTTRKDPPPNRRQLVVESLKLALKLASMKQAEGGTEPYDCGLHAWERWIEQLQDEDLLVGADPETFKTRVMGNAWIFHSLIDARRAAAEYLTAVRGLFDRGASAVLGRAAECYQAMVETVLTRRDPLEIAPPPAAVDAGRPWTNEMRRAQAAILAEALELEKRAWAEIEAGLVEAGETA